MHALLNVSISFWGGFEQFWYWKIKPQENYVWKFNNYAPIQHKCYFARSLSFQCYLHFASKKHLHYALVHLNFDQVTCNDSIIDMSLEWAMQM